LKTVDGFKLEIEYRKITMFLILLKVINLHFEILKTILFLKHQFLSAKEIILAKFITKLISLIKILQRYSERWDSCSIPENT